MNKMQRGELAEFEACFTFACPKVTISFSFCSVAEPRSRNQIASWSRSRNYELRLRPSSGSGSFLFIKDLKKIL
jgi:hypothetical protein